MTTCGGGVSRAADAVLDHERNRSQQVRATGAAPSEPTSVHRRIGFHVPVSRQGLSDPAPDAGHRLSWCPVKPRLSGRGPKADHAIGRAQLTGALSVGKFTKQIPVCAHLTCPIMTGVWVPTTWCVRPASSRWSPGYPAGPCRDRRRRSAVGHRRTIRRPVGRWRWSPRRRGTRTS